MFTLRHHFVLVVLIDRFRQSIENAPDVAQAYFLLDGIGLPFCLLVVAVLEIYFHGVFVHNFLSQPIGENIGIEGRGQEIEVRLPALLLDPPLSEDEVGFEVLTFLAS
jgi:hypothetical protein